MNANDKADAAWDDYVSQQQEEKIEELERELNAANSRIELLMSANADVARIAGERDEAENRIRILIAERDTARLQADKKHSLRGEFESLLGTDNIEEGIKAVKEMKDHIKRLEEENDAMRADLLLWNEQEVKP